LLNVDKKILDCKKILKENNVKGSSRRVLLFASPRWIDNLFKNYD
jgi:hypothetical protein